MVLAEKTVEVLSVSAVQQEQRQIKIAFAGSDSLSGVGQHCLRAITHKNTPELDRLRMINFQNRGGSL